MKAVEITDSTLAVYGRRPRKDLWVLSHNPHFIEIVNRSWSSYEKDGGVSLEEMRRRHRLQGKPSRRRKGR